MNAKVLKYFLIVAAAALIPALSFAQDDTDNYYYQPYPAMHRVDYGIKAGLNWAHFRQNSVPGFSRSFSDELKDSRLGFVGGGFLSYNVSPYFAVQPEVLFKQDGAKFPTTANSSTANGKTLINYLEIPVLARFNVAPNSSVNPMIYAGPAMDIRLSDKTQTPSATGGTVTVNNANIRNVDWAATAGLGLNFGVGTYKTNSVSLEARYTLGLRTINKTQPLIGPTTSRNGALSVMLGYTF